jgi:Protein of unknown function (DUF4232)
VLRGLGVLLVRRSAVLAVTLVIGGCGAQVVGSGRPAPAPASRSVPAFPATLNPDGTVPWVSTPAVDPFLTPAPAPPPAVGPTCTAGQLRGVLPGWVSGQASNDGGMDPLAAASLHGWVNLANISASPCTLDGVPAVTLMSHGVPAHVDYARFGTSKAVKVGLPAHGTANFRIDWGAPYCPGQRGLYPGPPARGPFSLRAAVDGLTLDITVHSTASPGCVLEDTHPNVTTSSVVTSPIGPGAVTPGPPAARPSPLRALRATAKDYPGRIPPGHLLKFVITLANPTDVALSLTAPPPPGYAIGAYCTRTLSRPGYQFARTYSLNNRPRPAVPAHGSVRFAMELTIPTTACPTDRLSITWQSPPPGYGLQGPHTAFAVALSG